MAFTRAGGWLLGFAASAGATLAHASGTAALNGHVENEQQLVIGAWVELRELGKSVTTESDGGYAFDGSISHDNYNVPALPLDQFHSGTFVNFYDNHYQNGYNISADAMRNFHAAHPGLFVKADPAALRHPCDGRSGQGDARHIAIRTIAGPCHAPRVQPVAKQIPSHRRGMCRSPAPHRQLRNS